MRRWTVTLQLGRRTGQLHQLAQHVVGGRLRLLDPRDVLRARDHHVVGERVGGDAAAVVAHHRDRAQPAPPRLGQRLDHVARVAARGERQQHVARAARRR